MQLAELCSFATSPINKHTDDVLYIHVPYAFKKSFGRGSIIKTKTGRSLNYLQKIIFCMYYSYFIYLPGLYLNIKTRI